MSLRLRLLTFALRVFAKPHMRRVAAPEILRADMERWARLLPLAPFTSLVPLTVGGLRALSIRSGPVRHDAVILHFHGGAFVAGSPQTHKAMLSRLARLARLEVIAPAYRLAPEHPFPAAVNDAEAVWDDLLAKGFAPDRIVLSGDSAGGALALSLLVRLCRRGTPPAALVALSPWTDLTGSAPSIILLEDKDPLLAAERVAEVAQLYLQGHRADDPAASPLFADFPGAPPILLQTSEADILRDDAMRLEQRLRAAGCEVLLQLWPDTPHAWHLFDGWIPEAREALREAALFANKALNAPPRR